MARETCKCCGIDIYDDYAYECPVCGNIVCSICFDGEMCDDCRQALNEGHTVLGDKELKNEKLRKVKQFTERRSKRSY